MNTFSVSLIVAAAAALPAFAHAQVITNQQIVVTAPKAALSVPAVLAEVGQRSTYEMSDGHRLVVEARGRLLRVRHAGQAAQLLRPNAQGRFVSSDQQVALQMSRDDRGDTLVSYSYTAPAL